MENVYHYIEPWQSDYNSILAKHVAKDLIDHIDSNLDYETESDSVNEISQAIYMHCYFAKS